MRSLRKIFDKKGNIKKVSYPNGARKFFIKGAEVDYDEYCFKIKERRTLRKFLRRPTSNNSIIEFETHEQILVGQYVYVLGTTNLVTAIPALNTNNPIGICAQSTTGLSTNTSGRVTVRLINNPSNPNANIVSI